MPLDHSVCFFLFSLFVQHKKSWIELFKSSTNPLVHGAYEFLGFCLQLYKRQSVIFPSLVNSAHLSMTRISVFKNLLSSVRKV